MTNEFILVVFMCILLAGVIIGAWLKERSYDLAERRKPEPVYKPPIATHIPQSNLEAFLRKPVITVRHKQVKSVPKKPKPLLERAGVLNMPPLPNGKTESYF